MEGPKHNILKNRIALELQKVGYYVIQEGIIEHYQIDIIAFNNDRVVKLIEIVNTQLLTNAMAKLNSINIKDCEKAIVRYRKKRNPKAEVIIQKIKDSGILFLEVDP